MPETKTAAKKPAAEKPAAKKPAEKKAAAKKPAAKVAEVIIQSPLGGEITPEAILKKVGQVEELSDPLTSQTIWTVIWLPKS